MRYQNKFRSVIPIITLLLAVTVPYSRWVAVAYSDFLIEDSGLFLHIGQRLLAGDRLYVDVWDNKPPLIYYINAAGLFLTGGTPMGVVFLCLAASWLALLILWSALRNHEVWPITGIVLVFQHLAMFRISLHPNYTETFAMPLQAAAIALLLNEVRTSQSGRFAVLQGMLVGLLVSVRPNNVGVAVTYGLWIVVSCRFTPARVGGVAIRCFLGIALTLAVVFAPLFLQNTWRECIYASVSSAASYAVENGNFRRIVTAILGFYRLSSTALMPTATGAIITAVALFRSLTHKARQCIAIACCWWAVEVVMSCISGYGWPHYYLMWLVPMSTVSILVWNTIAEELHFELRTPLRCTFAALLLWMTLSHGFELIRESQPKVTTEKTVALVQKYARRGDLFTAWGAMGHDLWFRLNLRPGAALFHEAAYTNRDIYRLLVSRFLDDLERKRPRVVLENRSVVPLFAEVNPEGRLNYAFVPSHFEGWDTPEIRTRKDQLALEYRIVEVQGNMVLFIRRDQ